MRKLLIVGLVITVIAGLCYGAVRVNVDLAGEVADHSDWAVIGQEFTISLAVSDNFYVLGIPSMDSAVTLLYLRCLTLDASDLPYQFSLCLGDTVDPCSCAVPDLRCDKFLMTDILRSHRDTDDLMLADSIFIRNPNAVAIRVKVFAAGIDK